MALEPHSLRSKVARRIFVVFLVCAIIPFAGLLSMSYYEVATFFNNRNQQQLRALAKIIGMDLFERLTLLEASLKIISSATLGLDGVPNTLAIENLPFNPRDRWKSILLLSSTGSQHALLGQMAPVPEFSPSDRQKLTAGKTLMKIISTSGDKSRIFIVSITRTRQAEPDILIGEVEDSYLWDFEKSRLMPNYARLCVTDDSGIALMCNPQEGIGTSDLEWNSHGQNNIAGRWHLPLKFEFQTLGWNIALETSNQGAFASIAEIKRPFFLGIVISLGLSILFAIFSIRKRLVPVEQLQEGTRRIAKNDFSFRVNIQSNDEFEELANSINAMATQLGRQFHTLMTKSDIDRGVLSLLSTDAIVQTVLSRAMSVFPCDAGSVLLFGGASSVTDRFYLSINSNMSTSQKESLGPGLDEEPGLTEGLSCMEIRKGENFLVRHLARANTLSVFSENEVEVAHSKSVGLEGVRSIMSAPLIVQDNTLAVLTFYSRERDHFNAQRLDLFRNLTAQVAIAIYNAQLFETVKRQAAELEKSNKTKDEFLGIVSHELRTPLNVILGYLRLLHEGALGEINEEQNRALNTVAKHSQDLLEMIEGIVEVTQIQAGAVRVENRLVDLVSLFDDLRFRYDALPRGEAVTLSWSYARDLPKLETDQSKLMRILKNLISNAIKFTDQGYIRVSAIYLLEQSMVKFRIEDTGIGIPEESQALIFEIFRQFDSSKTREYGGLGLGLYVVKLFAALIGATVAVKSTPGHGSIFTVTVPLVNKNVLPVGTGTALQCSTSAKTAYDGL